MRNNLPLRSNSGDKSPHFQAVRQAWILAALVVAGCAPETAEFSINQRTLDLIDDARKPIQDEVNASFGTPQNLVAWLRFPVDFGRHEGSVVSVPSEGADFQFSVKMASLPQRDTDFSGLSMIWTSGKFKNTPVPVRTYDIQTGELTLAAKLPELPAAGDQFVVVGDVLQQGRKAYMTHCMHCHGVAGDGNGPTAKYLNPRPRDYRQGKFKFKSTEFGDKPSRADLRKTIKQGIPGTYMPSFLLLPDDELDAIVEYVRWLSIRGEFEEKLVVNLETGFSRTAYDERTAGDESRQDVLAELENEMTYFSEWVDTAAQELAEAWQEADDEASVVVPSIARTPDSFESRQRGRELFLGKTAQCAACHGVSTRGDGPQTAAYNKKPDGSEWEQPGLFDDWGNPIQPRNLMSGQYRGGRRPVDVFRRIHQGIPGTPMPQGSKSLKEPQIWDLVNYVMSIPYDGPTPKADGTAKKTAARTKAAAH